MCLLSLTLSQSLFGQEQPRIGFAAFTAEDPSIRENLLIQLENESMAALFRTGMFKIIDRQGLPELLRLREAQKQEAHLDNKQALESMGVRYLFLVNLSNNKQTREQSGEQNRVFYNKVDARFRLLDIQTGAILASESVPVSGAKFVSKRDPAYNADLSRFGTTLEQLLITSFARKAANIVATSLPGEIEIVEVLKGSKKKVTHVLLVSQKPLVSRYNVTLYIKEEVMVNGEKLVREKQVGNMGIRAVFGQFAEAKIGKGKKEIAQLWEQKTPVYGKLVGDYSFMVDVLEQYIID